MKKIFLLVLIITIFSSCARPDAVPERQTRRQSNPVAESVEELGAFTLLWYVNGSDLESGGETGHGGAFTRNLKELMTHLPSDHRVNTVIFSGGTSKWETEGFEPNQNQIHYITRNGLSHGEILPRGSIADPDTLADFLNRAVKKFPAERYGLVFWNHGSSVPIGFGFDEVNEPATINSLDIARGIEAGMGGKRLSFIGFDTCLMAAAETAALLAPYADYLVASEELEPNAGWDYAPLAKALTSPVVKRQKVRAYSTPELCKIAADAFYDASLKENPEEAVTVSVTNLSRMADVVTAAERFALAARKELHKGNFSGVAKARAGAKYFGGADESADMVDLVHLAQRFGNGYPDEADDLISAVRDAVVYNRRSKNSPNSNGLSVYFPLENEAIMEDYLDVYLSMGFSENYTSLIREFSAQLSAGDADSKDLDVKVRGEKERFSVTLPKDVAKNAVSLRGVLLDKFDDDVYLILSFIDAVVDGDTGHAELPDTWLTLDGSLLCARPGDAGNLSAPVSVNGVDMNLLMARNGNEYSVSGVSPDGGENIAASALITLERGDIVTPRYPLFDINSDNEEDGYLPGAPIVVGDGVELIPARLPPGKYYFGFYVVDVYDNHFLTDVRTVNR
ncbi:MAG: clostripain-related cysteine peptidase [Oscillospiraceae bacterium]|nr:clostripain-related cysteine peptidase [Oscillospiraceae bacterium]